MKNERGFTLIELLVVVLIIGIIASVALFSFGDFGRSRQVKVTAEQFIVYIKLLEQKAILEMTTLGVTINNEGYETYRYLNDNNWQPMLKNNLIFHRPFPKDMVVGLQNKIMAAPKSPNIIISPSGDITEFKLILGSASQPTMYTVIGQHNGDLTLNNSQK